MYEIGARVVYGGSGVCTVSGIGPLEAGGKPYYTLSPQCGTQTIYVPVDAKVFMRPILTPEGAEALIRQIPAIQAEPMEGKNLQMLSQYYQQAFHSHSCSDLIRLIKTICARGADARRDKRKPYKLDEDYRRRAEDLLHGELAAALGLRCEEVPEYIARVLREGEEAGDLPPAGAG